MMSTPPRVAIQQSMARIVSFYHGSADTPLANHGDFFNTHADYNHYGSAAILAVGASLSLPAV
jgi:hypothetical protein